MKKLFLVMIAIALCAAIIPSVSADTVTNNYSIPWSNTDWGIPASDNYFQVAQFDSSLGTLNSINLSFAGSYISSLTADNLNLPPDSPIQDRYITNYQIQSSMNFLGPDNASLVSLDFGGNHVLVTSDTKVTVLPGEIATVNAGPYSGTGSYDITSLSSYFSEFSGTGDVNLPVTTNTYAVMGGSSGWIMNMTTEAMANLAVAYDYTPVPEPSSLVALLAGMGGLVGLIRRRRNK